MARGSSDDQFEGRLATAANDCMPPVAVISATWDGREMESPAATLSAALQGRECRARRREADWSFDFAELNIAATVPWRVVTADGIAHGDEDDGQWFGLPQPVDARLAPTNCCRGKRSPTSTGRANRRFARSFDGGTCLDFFNNSSGYEGWQASVPANGKELTVIALGGGRLTTHLCPFSTRFSPLSLFIPRRFSFRSAVEGPMDASLIIVALDCAGARRADRLAARLRAAGNRARRSPNRCGCSSMAWSRSATGSRRRSGR